MAGISKLKCDGVCRKPMGSKDGPFYAFPTQHRVERQGHKKVRGRVEYVEREVVSCHVFCGSDCYNAWQRGRGGDAPRLRETASEATWLC